MAMLILTLQMDPRSQAFFEHLRQLHFPPERNLIPAHLTLFHQLPESDAVRAMLQQTAEGQAQFLMRCCALRFLGRGVAYELSSPTLLSLQRALARAFDGHLIAQDRQRFTPHIVVQNKVSGEQARRLLAQLQPAPLPSSVLACGLDLWRYLGGPWQHLQCFAFPPIG